MANFEISVFLFSGKNMDIATNTTKTLCLYSFMVVYQNEGYTVKIVYSENRQCVILTFPKQEILLLQMNKTTDCNCIFTP